jgi:3-oxoacyl-[acyl-carrier protein] reductase
MLLHNKIAVVTGSARGIGLAAANRLVGEGAAVICPDVSAPGAGIVAADVPGLYAARLDVSDKNGVDAFFAEVLERFGRIDILVNNAGVCRDITDLRDMPEEEWREMFDINLMGTVHCSRAVIAPMKRQGTGRIINMASIAGECGGSASSMAYSASKAGIICLTKVLARKLGPDGITVNAVSPGYIITEMTRTHVHNLDSVPLRRRGTMEEVADAVLFLASDMASYITGATLDVNGGAYMA